MVWVHCSACGKRTVADVQDIGKVTAPNCCGKGVWVLGKDPKKEAPPHA